MSDDTTVASELEEVTSTTGEGAETDAETETSSSEAEDKEAQAKKTLEGQVKAAQAKIDANPALAAEILAKQPYLKDKVKLPSDATNNSDPKLDEEALFKSFEARQAAKQLQAEVDALELTDAQRTAFESEKQELIDAGISEDKAIAKARILTGVDAETLEAEKRGILKGRMALAPNGKPLASAQELDLENAKTDDEVLAVLKRQGVIRV